MLVSFLNQPFLLSPMSCRIGTFRSLCTKFQSTYYLRFLPAVIDAAATKGISMKEKYERIVVQILTRDEHLWIKGLTQKEAEELRKLYENRYNQ